MMKAIISGLSECHVVFPNFNGDRSADDIRVLVKVFERHLVAAGMTELQVSAAFDHHISTRRSFPTVSDIISAGSPGKMYQFNNGPYGFAALYPPDHPYVRDQVRAGTNIEAVAVTVSAAEAMGLPIAGKTSIAAAQPQRPTRTIQRQGIDR